MHRHPVANAVGLTIVLVVLALAVFVGLASAAGTPFPGLVPESSPLSGDLGQSRPNDFYRFVLEPNQQLRVTANTPTSLEVDLGIWEASATPSADLGHSLAWDTQTGSASELMYDAVAGRPTDVSLQVHRAGGSGTYAAAWAVLHAPALSIDITSTTIGYGESATIAGALMDLYTGMPASSQNVLLWYSYDNKYWKLSSAKTVTGPDGSFALAVSPKIKTWYRLTVGGQNGVGMVITDSFWVKPGVYLSTPYVPSRVRRGAAFTCSGYLKPRHASGGKVAKLYFDRLISGEWVRQATYRPVGRNYSSYTKFSSRVVLKTRGSWRVRAYHSSEQHAATYSGYRHFSVR